MQEGEKIVVDDIPAVFIKVIVFSSDFMPLHTRRQFLVKVFNSTIMIHEW